MSIWTLMKDAKPIATYTFEGDAQDFMSEKNAYPLMDFLAHNYAPAAMFAPVKNSVVLVGGDWTGRNVWQLIREGSRWLSPIEIEFNFEMPMEAASC